MGLLDGKVALVSGGSQGVGAAIVRAAAQAGAEAVVFTGRRGDVGQALADELAEYPVEYLQTDVSDVDQAIGSVQETIRRHGRIDCVVNCAGLVTRSSLVDTTPEHFDRHIAINTRGPFFIMQTAVKDMLSRSAPGSIVNILSTSMHGGQSILAPYVTSKAALAGATKNAAHAHRWDRIRINALNIGWTTTEGEDAIQRAAHGAQDGWLDEASQRVPMGRLGQPDEIADMVVFLLSDRSGVVTGAVLDWDQIVIGGLD